MKKLLLIVNPVSGKMKIKNALPQIEELFRQGGYTVDTVQTEYRGHATELAARCGEGYDLIVCGGGDGTLNEVINGVLEEKLDIPLGYIPAGSTNDFAASLGLSRDIPTAVQNILQGTPQKIDIGCFGKKNYFTYVASFGAFTAASYRAPQSLKNTLGHFAYVLEGIKDVTNIHADRVTVQADQYTFTGNYVFGSVTNSTSVGGLVKLRAGTVDLSDGVFEVVLVKQPHSLSDLASIVSCVMTADFSSDMFDFCKVSHVRFTSENGLAWTLDGEFMQGEPTQEVRNLHHAVTIVK